MKITLIIFSIIFSIHAKKIFAYSDLTSISIELEDSRNQKVTVILQGPDGVPLDIVVVNPGPWSVDLKNLPPDHYSVIFHSEGFAEQRVSITFKDGKFLARSGLTDNICKLFLKRYATLEIVWNPNQGRGLDLESAKREVFTTSYLGNHPVIRPDWTFAQTISGVKEQRVSLQSGPNLVLRKHRYSGFFGVSFPGINENFEDAKFAPTNDMYRGDAMIALRKGDWFYLRICGHIPETLAYAKVRVLDTGLAPPVDKNLLTERPLEWQRAINTAGRFWKIVE